VALIYDLTEVRDFPGLGYRLPIWRKEEIDVLETNPLIFYYPEVRYYSNNHFQPPAFQVTYIH